MYRLYTIYHISYTHITHNGLLLEQTLPAQGTVDRRTLIEAPETKCDVNKTKRQPLPSDFLTNEKPQIHSNDPDVNRAQESTTKQRKVTMVEQNNGDLAVSKTQQVATNKQKPTVISQSVMGLPAASKISDANNLKKIFESAKHDQNGLATTPAETSSSLSTSLTEETMCVRLCVRRHHQSHRIKRMNNPEKCTPVV